MGVGGEERRTCRELRYVSTWWSPPFQSTTMRQGRFFFFTRGEIHDVHDDRESVTRREAGIWKREVETKKVREPQTLILPPKSRLTIQRTVVPPLSPVRFVFKTDVQYPGLRPIKRDVGVFPGNVNIKKYILICDVFRQFCRRRRTKQPRDVRARVQMFLFKEVH